MLSLAAPAWLHAGDPADTASRTDVAGSERPLRTEQHQMIAARRQCGAALRRDLDNLVAIDVHTHVRLPDRRHPMRFTQDLEAAASGGR